MSGVKRVIIIIGILGWSITNAFSQVDSTLILTYEAFISQVLNHHPLAKKADLKLRSAQAELLGAKGLLDPNIHSAFDQKNFDGKLYYRQYQGNINIPTKLGVEVVGGYENSSGEFLNPENKTDLFGLWHLGVEVNVWQGLLINERKTALDQAILYQELNNNERKLAINKLAYEASVSYLIWQQYENTSEILKENEVIAKAYFNNTKQVFNNGEKTAMDTLEAYILHQDAIALIQSNQMYITKSRLLLENFLWFDEAPIALQITTKPEQYQEGVSEDSELSMDFSVENHPLLLSSLNKLSILEVGQQLKKEKLKPKLKLKFNPLLASSQNGIGPSYSIHDYKFGIDFSLPLFFRSEKADIQRGQIKIEETQLDIQNKRNELVNKLENSWQQQLLLQQQIRLLERNIEGYKRLLDGENTKFNFGESSVFLLNKRQEKYINGRLKLIETYTKRHLEVLKFLFFSNMIVVD